jgi:hypothetical protein
MQPSHHFVFDPHLHGRMCFCLSNFFHTHGPGRITACTWMILDYHLLHMGWVIQARPTFHYMGWVTQLWDQLASNSDTYDLDTSRVRRRRRRSLITDDGTGDPTSQTQSPPHRRLGLTKGPACLATRPWETRGATRVVVWEEGDRHGGELQGWGS